MATLKKKINELTQKENPVLADSIVISDSENSGRGALVEITDIQTLIGGGGGAVDSVAGKTGAVTLDAADIAETETLKIFTADERTKLTGIAENANNYTHPASHPQSMIEGLDDALAAKAPLASPALTGTPTAPTAAVGTNTTQLATTEFVQDALAEISMDADPYSVKLTGDQSIAGIKTFTSSPVLPTPTAGDNTTKAATTAFVQAAVAGVTPGGAVDSVAGKTGVVTLDASDIAETAALKIMTADERTKLTGIAENANNYTHPASHPQSMIEGLDDALAAKAPLASPALTGTPTAPTAAVGTNTTQLATTAFVQAAVAEISMDADPYSVKLTGDQSIAGIKTFTSSPVLPTPTAGDNTTKGATTEFVQDALEACRPKHTYIYISTASTSIDAEKGNTYGVDADSCTLTLPDTNTAGYVDGDEISVVLGVTEARELSIVSTNNIVRDAGVQPQNTPFNISGIGTFITFIKCSYSWVMSYPESELSKKAPLASPALTGTPTAPTAAPGTNTTQLATTAFCANFAEKWTYAYTEDGGAIIASAWTMHAFGDSGTLTLPLASSVASGVQVAAIVVQGGAEVVLTRSGSDQFVTPAGLAHTYTLRGDGSSIVMVRVTETAWACLGAPESLINAAVAGVTASSIGLGSVDNTADIDKPVSTAQATALAAKAPLASPALTGTPTAPTAAVGTNTTQLATTAFCSNFNQKWTYSYNAGGSITGAAWTMHAFAASGTLTLPLASSVASGVQVAAIAVIGGAEVVLTRSGSDQFVTPTGLATTYTLRGNGSSIVLVRVTPSAWACVGAPDSLINAKAEGALLTEGTPSGPTATGTKGMIRYDANYVYICTATNTWIRFAKDGSWT